MKKIVLTESQYKMLQTEGLEYTPEKIDEFVNEANRILKLSDDLIISTINTIENITIGYIMEETENFENYIKKIEKSREGLEKKFNFFFDVIEMYDFMNLPDNVIKLEMINGKLDNNQNEMYRLVSALEGILDSVKTIMVTKNQE